MINRVQAKECARQNIRENRWPIIGAFFVVSLITVGSTLLNYIPVIGTVVQIALTGIIAYGTASYSLKIAKGETVELGDIFEGFNHMGPAAILQIMQSIFIGLWSLLFVIPGIVKSYSYSMSMYILIEHPEYSWKEAIDESKRITDGNKMDLFVVGLSFLGWAILTSFTFGILSLWLVPYMSITMAHVYNQIKRDHPASFSEASMQADSIVEDKKDLL